MVNFVLGDFIARLNIAKQQHLKSIYVPNTKLVREFLALFIELGIIRNFERIDNRSVEVTLKYKKRRPVFKKLKLVSTPSKNVYVDLIKLAKLRDRSSACIYILSTTEGLKMDFDCLFLRISGKVMIKIVL
jgi:ribosomal protein S8